MNDHGVVGADEVVRAFVLAEAHPLSGLAQDWFGPWFSARKLSLEEVQLRLIDGRDADMLALARQALAEGRGFGTNDHALFNGFPSDAEWHRVSLSREDFQTMRYLAFPPWLRLSGGTRLVTQGARAIKSGDIRGETTIADRVGAIADALRSGVTMNALVLGQEHNEPLVLIEGHHRATAMVLSGQMDDVPALVGGVSSFARWVFR